MTIIKKLWIKYRLYLRKLDRNDTEFDIYMSNVRKCSTICRKLIHSEDSELIIAPISDKKYIRNDKLGILEIARLIIPNICDIYNNIFIYLKICY